MKIFDEGPMSVVIFYIFSIICTASAKYGNTIRFIRSYVENEGKPTFLVCNLCWETNGEVALANVLSQLGVRMSKPMTTSKYLDHELFFLMDLDCPGAFEVLSNASTNGLLRSPYRWLVLSSEMEHSLEELDLLADSDFVLAQATETGFSLNELHKPSFTGPIQVTQRGYFNGTFFDIRPHRSLFRRRKDVMGHTLTMSNVIQDNNRTQYHLPKENRLEPEHDSIAKISWSNVRLAFEVLNATPRYIFSHRWGYKQNGVWSGMIDDLYSNRADVGTNCLVLQERLSVVVYTDVLAPFHVRFIFRQPPLSYVSNIFSLPFSTGVWVAMAICTALSAVSLYLASRWEVTLGKSPSQLDGSIGDALLLTMSAVGQQGCVMEPRKASGRIMVLVLFTALMALYAAYSANIVVLLQAPSDSIRTLAQLAHSKLTVAAYDVDYNYFVFKMYKDPVRLEISNKIIPEKGKKQFYSFNDGVERIRQGLFAFHSIAEPVYRRIAETFYEMEKCDLMEIDFMNDFDPFTPVKKDSPYLELLRVAFKQIREVGIRSSLNRRMQIPKPRCADKMTAFSSVGLLDLRPVLILMLYGILISVVILVAEISIFRL
ncbi:glutamate receptor-like [Hyposmocoma kahamanoa]|uniref:glutamate receptor-like n=1 Tax=Hyposmocoma kahamanoa TaxID=1477025 RepID=UPI000E6D67B9|nr:glutamate receptor-like [Hyposmocoma kahamanoa]